MRTCAPRRRSRSRTGGSSESRTRSALSAETPPTSTERGEGREPVHDPCRPQQAARRRSRGGGEERAGHRGQERAQPQPGDMGDDQEVHRHEDRQEQHCPRARHTDDLTFDRRARERGADRDDRRRADDRDDPEHHCAEARPGGGEEHRPRVEADRLADPDEAEQLERVGTRRPGRSRGRRAPRRCTRRSRPAPEPSRAASSAAVRDRRAELLRIGLEAGEHRQRHEPDRAHRHVEDDVDDAVGEPVDPDRRPARRRGP